MSLAEVIRRGAECITRVYPPISDTSSDATLPGPCAMKLAEDPFTRNDWRYALHE